MRTMSNSTLRQRVPVERIATRHLIHRGSPGLGKYRSKSTLRPRLRVPAVAPTILGVIVEADG
jgi:hypothetical protein